MKHVVLSVHVRNNLKSMEKSEQVRNSQNKSEKNEKDLSNPKNLKNQEHKINIKNITSPRKSEPVRENIASESRILKNPEKPDRSNTPKGQHNASSDFVQIVMVKIRRS